MIEVERAGPYELERFEEQLSDAAPELLLAAEEMLRSLDGSRFQVMIAAKKLRAAVAKVRDVNRRTDHQEPAVHPRTRGCCVSRAGNQRGLPASTCWGGITGSVAADGKGAG